MAKIEFGGLDDYRARLTALGADITGICKAATYNAAAIVIEAIKANIPVNSGDLRESTALSKYEDDDGYIYTQVYFPGYDRNGHPNPVKARVLESGSSTRTKHPFVRPAVNSVKKAAEIQIEMDLDKIIKQKTL